MDVFLQPVVEELKELWNIGFQVRDEANDEVFLVTCRASMDDKSLFGSIVFI